MALYEWPIDAHKPPIPWTHAGTRRSPNIRFEPSVVRALYRTVQFLVRVRCRKPLIRAHGIARARSARGRRRFRKSRNYVRAPGLPAGLSRAAADGSGESTGNPPSFRMTRGSRDASGHDDARAAREIGRVLLRRTRTSGCHSESSAGGQAGSIGPAESLARRGRRQ